MSKNKKFRPYEGYVVAAHINILLIRSLAKELNIDAGVVANACERTGVMLQADIMDLSADAARVIPQQDKAKPNEN